MRVRVIVYLNSNSCVEGWNPKVVARMPKEIGHRFPVWINRKTAIEKVLVDQLVASVPASQSIAGYQKIISELNHLHHATEHLVYVAAAIHERLNPEQTLRHQQLTKAHGKIIRPFLECDAGWNSHVHVAQTLNDCFKSYAASRRDFCNRRMQMIWSLSVSSDATFKFTKDIWAGDKKPYDGMVTCMFLGELIGAQGALRAGKETEDTNSLLEGLAARKQKSQGAMKDLQSWRLDNCCSGGRNQVVSRFPELAADCVGHKGTDFTPLGFELHSVTVVDAESRDSCENICQMIKALDCVVGCDFEWFSPTMLNRSSTEGTKKVGLVQMSSGNHCWLFRVDGPGSLDGVPGPLKRLLQDASVEKAGVNITGDRTKLLNDHGVDMKGLVELQLLASVKLGPNCVKSLEDLVHHCLDKVLPKIPAIRGSNWNDRLSPDQTKYAAADAYASFMVHQHLKELPLHSLLQGLSQDLDPDKMTCEPLRTALKARGRASSGRKLELQARLKQALEEEEQAREQQRQAESLLAGARLAAGGMSTAHHSGGLQSMHQALNESCAHDGAMAPVNAACKPALQRVKLDPFHFLKRYSDVVPKSSPLFGVFTNCMRGALFINDEEEMEVHRDFLVARGMQREDADALGNSYFAKHVRRWIPPPDELFTRIEAVFQFFASLKFPAAEVPLISEKAREVHANQMQHVLNGCLSDVPGLSMCHVIGFNSYGMPKYRCERGSSQLEGYHVHLRECIRARHLSPELADAILQEFNFRWNANAASKNLYGHDYGHYRHELVEELWDLVQEYKEFFEHDVHPEWKASMQDTGERFGLGRCVHDDAHAQCHEAERKEDAPITQIELRSVIEGVHDRKLTADELVRLGQQELTVQSTSDGLSFSELKSWIIGVTGCTEFEPRAANKLESFKEGDKVALKAIAAECVNCVQSVAASAKLIPAAEGWLSEQQNVPTPTSSMFSQQEFHLFMTLFDNLSKGGKQTVKYAELCTK